ncbi:MAG: hypothetical protein ACRDNE_10760 [Gaiellaceae bacterium]
MDGTRQYARGIPIWATLIALERESEVVCAGFSNASPRTCLAKGMVLRPDGGGCRSRYSVSKVWYRRGCFERRILYMGPVAVVTYNRMVVGG